MNKAALLMEIVRLPDEERRELLEAAWETLSEEEFAPLTPEQEAELDRRIAEHERNPGRAIPWQEVVADLRSRFK